MIQLQIIRVATELFELANQEETKTEAQYHAAVDQAASEVLSRHPDFSRDLIIFAMGRALGRWERARREDEGEAAMIDVAEVATEIRHLISMGATERELASLVVRYHPDLDRKAFLAALQDATAAAEAAAAKRH